LADPKAHQSMREQERKTLRDYKQGYWWRPGHLTPDRLPNVMP